MAPIVFNWCHLGVVTPMRQIQFFFDDLKKLAYYMQGPTLIGFVNLVWISCSGSKENEASKTNR